MWDIYLALTGDFLTCLEVDLFISTFPFLHVRNFNQTEIRNPLGECVGFNVPLDT